LPSCPVPPVAQAAVLPCSACWTLGSGARLGRSWASHEWWRQDHDWRWRRCQARVSPIPPCLLFDAKNRELRQFMAIQDHVLSWMKCVMRTGCGSTRGKHPAKGHDRASTAGRHGPHFCLVLSSLFSAWRAPCPVMQRTAKGFVLDETGQQLVPRNSKQRERDIGRKGPLTLHACLAGQGNE
jgi:hypothetical protein